MGKPKVDISVLQSFAKSKGGMLLSTSYISNKHSVLWQCKEGHSFTAKWNSISSTDGTWCKYCTGLNKPNINELHQYAKNKKGICHLSEYVNSRHSILWECEKGHMWKMNWAHIKCSNTWCPACNGSPRYSLGDIDTFIRSKKGILLSTEYKNQDTPLVIQCDKKHTWTTNWGNIHNANSWCPSCQTLKSEKECISLAETILNMPLSKKRIYFNKENNRQFLEFDGYNEEHKIAVEYNGRQHYKQNNLFHKTAADFIKQQERDIRKRTYCKENGIVLIEVPYNSDVKTIILQHKQESRWKE